VQTHKKNRKREKPKMKKFRIQASLQSGENNRPQILTIDFEAPKTATMKTVNKMAVERIQAMLQGTPEPHSYKILKIDEHITRFEA